MNEEVYVKFLYDRTRHVVKKLKDGRSYIVTNREDRLLKNGLKGTVGNPVKRGQLYDLLDRLYRNVFEQNASEMSRVLDELYPSGEYRRDKLYDTIRSLKEKHKGVNRAVKRKLKRYVNKLTAEQRKELREILARKEISSPIEEDLGEKKTEDISRGRRVLRQK